MANSVNKVILLGNVGRDPELRYTASGNPRTEFSLATSYWSKNLKGEEGKDGAEVTEWHNVIVWGDLAERAIKFIEKGTKLYVEGRITTRTWDDDTGVKHYRTEIIANQLVAAGAKKDGGGSWDTPYARGKSDSGGGSVDVDDLPFE